MKNKVLALILASTLWFSQIPMANAFYDVTGPMRLLYLTKILLENYKRFKQLKAMIRDAKSRDTYLRFINEGLDNATGLLKILPIEDEKILAEFKNFEQAKQMINEIYGIIPDSKEALMHGLHDQSVAESIKLINKSREYTQKQEENAINIFHAGANASPRGAARMNAQTSAQILHSLNQLIKVNGQLLKLASTHFAYQNKKGKQSVGNFQKIGKDVEQSFSSFKGDFKLPKF